MPARGEPFKLPNLPGYNAGHCSQANTNPALSQSLQVHRGQSIVREDNARPRTAAAVPGARRPCPFAYDGTDDETGVHAAPARMPTPPSKALCQAKLPAWLAWDGQVLRFHAFFKESIPEGPTEHWRVRKCTLLYYLEDGSTQIEEPVEDNSGLYQGTLLRRHRILLANGAVLSWRDLSVGTSVSIYNRVFRICGCDGFTRRFMDAHGRPQAEDTEPPRDPYHSHLDTQKAKKEAAKARVADEIRPIDTQHYLNHARKVLRFYACWDDTRRPFGDKMPFVIHYYLADDTMEVREVRLRNDGRDPFPIFVRRMPIPKKAYAVGIRPRSAQSRREQNRDYYNWRDLSVGDTVSIFGRPMLLTDTDDFTREWYKARAGAMDCDFEPVQVEYERRTKAPTPDAPPDPMGIGRDEDTIGNVRALVPKQPHADKSKLERYGSQALRFVARFAYAPDAGVEPLGPADMERAFIFTFFLASDEIFIYEPPIRNSGISGGKFFERARPHRPGTREYFALADFFVGAKIPLVSRLWELVDADTWTLDFMEKHPQTFPWAHFPAALQRVCGAVRRELPEHAARELLLTADASGNGAVPFRRFHAELQRAGVDVSLHEVITLSRHWSADGSIVPVQSFLDALFPAQQRAGLPGNRCDQADEAAQEDADITVRLHSLRCSESSKRMSPRTAASATASAAARSPLQPRTNQQEAPKRASFANAPFEPSGKASCPDLLTSPEALHHSLQRPASRPSSAMKSASLPQAYAYEPYGRASLVRTPSHLRSSSRH